MSSEELIIHPIITGNLRYSYEEEIGNELVVDDIVAAAKAVQEGSHDEL